MYFAIWALIVGALLITMALSGTWLRRLPVSTAMLYLAAGFGLGPAGLALMAPDPLTYSGILERAAEVAVLILYAHRCFFLLAIIPAASKGWFPMHKSKLSAIVIDCQTNDLTEATHFWSAALGRTVDTSEKPASNKYVKLGSGNEELIVLAQKVPHPSRVHLDVETDDIEAEVKRLEALGARRIEKIETWWVMEAPTGHRFCVIRPQRQGRMPDDANQWQ